MITFVIGGSGSGKSEFAEGLLDSFKGRKYYVATMAVFDNETENKIKRHRKMRSGKGFETIECPQNLADIEIEENCALLLECLTNLAANQLFGGEKNEAETFIKIKEGLEKISRTSDEAVIVSGAVFGDNLDYSEETLRYMRLLGKINSFVASIADEVVEVVYSIPVYHKASGVKKL